MFKRSLYLTCFSLLALGYSACRDGNLNNPSAAPRALIKRARLHFEAYVDVPGIAVNKDNPLATLQRTVDWSDAYVYERHDGTRAVAVPVRFPENNTLRSTITNRNIALTESTRLLMHQDNNKTWHTEVVTLLPQPGYSGKAGTPFSGIVLVDDWYGNNLQQLQYTPDGKKNLLTAAKTDASRNGRPQLHQLSVCLTVYDQHATATGHTNNIAWPRTSCETLYVDGGQPANVALAYVHTK